MKGLLRSNQRTCRSPKTPVLSVSAVRPPNTAWLLGLLVWSRSIRHHRRRCPIGEPNACPMRPHGRRPTRVAGPNSAFPSHEPCFAPTSGIATAAERRCQICPDPLVRHHGRGHLPASSPPRCGLKDDDLYRGGWHVIDSRRAARAVSHSLAADRTKGRNAGVRSEDMLSSFRHRSHGVWSASRPPGESSGDETRCIAHPRHRNLATCPLSCSPCLAMGVPAFGQ